MKERIIEIVEIGKPQSLIQRENTPITELIKTDMLVKELNEQLLLYNVVGRSEQLFCCCDNPNGFKEMEESKETCSQCGKPY